MAQTRSHAAAPPPSTPSYIVTNEDAPALYGDNTISYFEAGGSPSAPSLTYQNTVTVGGNGGGGGNFAAHQLASDSNGQCLYVSDVGTGQIASVDVQTQLVTGIFSGSAQDIGTLNGMGLALNADYLYASFTDSNNIGTFQILPGCQLSFLGDTQVTGLNGGGVYAVAVTGSMLIATYGDGSIESFSIAGGTPMPNGDQQDSTGFTLDYNNLPAGIDITQDGRFAIFGDGAIRTVVEVSDISSGRLTATRVYNLGAGPTSTGPRAVLPGVGSTNVRLSPDESLLFISNNQSGNITAGFFNSATGAVLPGCNSPRLNGFYAPWYYLGSMVTENTSGNGGVLYVAEFGLPSSIGILTIHTGNRTCSFAESANSPTPDPSSNGNLLSIWAYPPRPF
jgi:6-phosphogluconolactonase (cycloisomerase 2 family)